MDSVDIDQQAVAIVISLADLWQARKSLLLLQAAAELAIRTLDQVGTFGVPTVVAGVTDVFAALAYRLANPCVALPGEVNTSIVFPGVNDGPDVLSKGRHGRSPDRIRVRPCLAR